MVGRVHHTRMTSPHLKGQRPPDQQMVVMHAVMAGAGPQTVCETECFANTGTLAKLYQLEAFANSNAGFLQEPHAKGWVTHTPETPFPLVEELNSSPDTFPLL